MFTTQYSSALGTLGNFTATAPVALGPRRKWPFQSSQPARRPAHPCADVAMPQHDADAQADGGAVPAAASGSQAKPSLRVMVVDTAMVLVWAALIPGLMWLGQAGGF